MSDDAEVVVVGAGPAGAACAYALARAGRAVILVDRGTAPGAKNVSGGRLYTAALDVLEPGLSACVPAERTIAVERLGVLDGERCLVVAAPAPTRPAGGPQSVTVVRSVLDAWLADLAEQAGASVLPGVAVEGLARTDGRVVGIRAGGEELRATTVVAADGTNSLLARELGVVRAPVSGQVATGVKEVVELPSGAIEERFGVGPGQGVAQLMVGCTRGLHGGGFLYTNATSVALGIVVDPAGVARFGTTPRELLEDLRAHPAIAALLRGGRVVEYAAHLVREDGAAGVPRRLTAPGFLVTGEAAGFVLNLGYTVRGMDLAVLSGLAAAEAILAGGERESAYRTALARTGVLGAMASARRYPGFLDADRIYEDYPRLALDVLQEVFTVPGSGSGNGTWAWTWSRSRSRSDGAARGVARARPVLPFAGAGAGRARRRAEGGAGTVSAEAEARLGVADLLGRDAFAVDEDYAHIAIDPAICRTCPHRACVAACPASLFSCDESGEVHFDHAGCLECGTCRVVCTPGGIVRWTYPHAGFGVTYTAS